MTATIRPTNAEVDVQQSARRVYDAETAFHAARQSGIDGWVAAAADRLHDALIEYRVARQQERFRRRTSSRPS